MSNIVWQRPDGSVAITHLTREALERMAWANQPANRALLADKIVIITERTAAESAIAIGRDQAARLEAVKLAAVAAIEAARQGGVAAILRLQRRLAAGELTPPAAAAELAQVRAELDSDLAELSHALHAAVSDCEEAAAAGAQREKDLAAIDAKLARIEEIERVRDTIGLDEHGHELVLQRNGQIPEDHVCVGHAVEVPADRTFRAALAFQGGELAHDMAKAREIQRNRIRAMRKPRLEALDCAQLRALATNNAATVASVEAQKQALRDAPADPVIAEASTVEELKAAIPACLL